MTKIGPPNLFTYNAKIAASNQKKGKMSFLGIICNYNIILKYFKYLVDRSAKCCTVLESMVHAIKLSK